jgi:hypothetical protein
VPPSETSSLRALSIRSQARDVHRAARTLAQAFAAGRWTWSRSDGARIPDVGDLEDRIYEVLERIDTGDLEPGWTTSSGRLRFTLDEDGKAVYLTLDIATFERIPVEGGGDRG